MIYSPCQQPNTGKIVFSRWLRKLKWVMAAGWSKRAVLRAGYGAVIAVLVLSAMEAYRIQISVSRQHLEIYRHFVEQDEALSTLRRNLWLAGNYVRDFFIQNTPRAGRRTGGAIAPAGRGR